MKKTFVLSAILIGVAVTASSQPCDVGFSVTGASFNQFADLYTTTVGQIVTFAATCFSPGNSFSWDFGDSSPSAGGATVKHAFARSGTFVVQLTIHKASGDAVSASTVYVLSDCEVPPAQPDIVFTAGVFRLPNGAPVASLGVPVSLSLDYATGPLQEVLWSFDDGSFATGYSVTHVFRSVGSRFVSVSGRGNCGRSGASSGIQVVGYSFEDVDALVILGAGRAGPSSTEITLANPTDVEQFGTVATVPTPDQISGCPGACIYFPYHLLPNGTTTVRLAPGSGAPNFVGTYYVVPDAGDAVPVVAARAVGRGSPISATLPVYRLSTLLSTFVPTPGIESPPTVLLGGRRSASVHSNLLLTVLQPPGTVDFSGANARVDVLDESGTTLASRDFRLEFGESRVVADIVGVLGIPSLDLGQVRVTQTGGTNLLRAALATTLESGAVTISSGLPPDNSYSVGLVPAVVLAGGGAVGNWDTEILLGDSIHSAGSTIISTTWPAVPDPPRQNVCSVSLPDSATIALLASSLPCLPSGATTIFLGRGALPEVSARIFDRSDPTRSADLPLATTGEPRLTNLAFPFSSGRLQLFLADMVGGVATDVKIEIWSSGGDLVRAFSRHIPAGGHIVLANLLETSDASGITDGQVRVTSTGGVAISGALAAVGSDGGFTITPGVNP